MNERTGMMIRHVLFIHCLIICAIFFAAKGEGMALEEAKYTVIMKEESFELRQYEPHIIAETMVEGDLTKPGMKVFVGCSSIFPGRIRKSSPLP